MIYGYLRVSSDEQDVNSQKQGVEQFAKDNNWTIETYITDEGVSGGKDPDKRNLGPLLKKVQKGDKIICSEISRLGRDLYMVMDILHFCMDRGCVIYTVKDRFTLGDDIQSKVLAFAFGLAAEIERQMIRQRTKEGLRLKMKQGILLGRALGTKAPQAYVFKNLEEQKNDILIALKYGVSQRNLAKKVGVDRNTLARHLVRWGVKIQTDEQKFLEKEQARKARERYRLQYKDSKWSVIDLPRDKVRELIMADKTIPEICNELQSYTYEQVYDSILCDEEFNPLYRQHAQKKLVCKRKHY
jgi:DNA invertase Pin-like site-specific DNA recombinase